MDEVTAIEKVIGVYLLFLSGIDNIVILNQLIWPISYYITTSYMQQSIPYIGLFSGLILFSHSFGKLLTHKLITHSSTRFYYKCILVSLSICCSFSILLLGLIPNYTGVLISRFLSGSCSNSQIILKKFLYRISTAQKSNWPSLTRSSLWAIKLGNIVGVCISCFLSTPKDFLPADSKFVTNQYLLISLVVMILHVSGLLLIFSIDMTGLQGQESTKYVELDESKEKKKAEENSDATVDNIKLEGNKEFNFRRFLKGSPMEYDEYQSEESINPNDVKYYSPRNVVNRPSIGRMPLSARPNVVESVHIPTEENIERGSIIDCKKTHISFIDEEFGNTMETPKLETIEVSLPPQKVEVTTHSSLRFSKFYRITQTFVSSLLIESIPFLLIVEGYCENPYQLGVYLVPAVSSGCLFRLFFMESILNKVSFSRVVMGFMGILTGFSTFLAAGMMFHLNILVIEGVLVVSYFCIEVIQPCGCVMISDSVALVLREREIESNDFYCIFVRAFACLASPSLIALIGYQYLLLLCSLGFSVLTLHSLRLNHLFPLMAKAPYTL